MYLLKCWLQNRKPILLCLGVIAALTVWAVFDTWTAYNEIMQRKPIGPAPPDFAIQGALFAGMLRLMPFFPLVMIGFAVMLGMNSLGNHTRQDVSLYLLTRPMTRTRMVWQEWGLCVGLLVLAALIPTALLAAATYLIGHTAPQRFILTAPMMTLMVLAFFGLVQLLVMVPTHRARPAGFLLFALYLLLPGALYEFWKVEWLLRFQEWTMSPLGWAWLPKAEFPLGAVLFWVALAPLFPLASQFVLQRKEF